MRVERKKIVGKAWGYEEIIVNNTLYCGKILTILRNKSCSIHYHEKKMETFYVIEGAIVLEVYKDLELTKCQTHLLVRGDSVTLEPRTPHKFYGVEPVNRFIEFSTHDDPKDSIRLKVP